MAKKDKHPGGRPTDYREEYNEQAEKLCLLGATDKELADFFEVSEQTINAWKQQFPEFLESIKNGKQRADANVAKSLYKRALGYSHPDVDIRVVSGEIVQTPLTKHYPPDTEAAKHWLNNRQRDKWRSKVDLEQTGANGGPIKHEVDVTLSAEESYKRMLGDGSK